MKKIRVAGIRQVLGLSQVEVLCLPRKLENIARILAPLARNGINLEFLQAHSLAEENFDVILGVRRGSIAAALGLLQGLREDLGRTEVRSREPVGVVSLFPHGNRAAVIGGFLSAFREAEIPLLAINFSLSALSGLLEESQVPEAIRALNEYFQLPG
jgi:aspartokinase